MVQKKPKGIKIQKFIETKEKGFSKHWNLFPYEAYRKINFSRWDVKYRLEGIKNGVWKQTANDNTTNNIKFFKYIRNKKTAKGSVSWRDKPGTKEMFGRIRPVQGD